MAQNKGIRAVLGRRYCVGITSVLRRCLWLRWGMRSRNVVSALRQIKRALLRREVGLSRQRTIEFQGMRLEFFRT